MTLLNRQASGVRAILSLDYHQVIDRSLDSTLEVFRCLQCHPHVAVIVLSKCSTRSLIDQALRFLERVVSITGYTIRDVPCFTVRDDFKADKLWRAIRGTEHEDTPVCHVDDKGSVVAGFESFFFLRLAWRPTRLLPSALNLRRWSCRSSQLTSKRVQPTCVINGDSATCQPKPNSA